MAEGYQPPDPALVDELRADSERRLSAAEFNAYVDAPMSDFEREEIDANIAWFTRRYPTPEARLAWLRRTYAMWASSLPKGTR